MAQYRIKSLLKYDSVGQRSFSYFSGMSNSLTIYWEGNFIKTLSLRCISLLIAVSSCKGKFIKSEERSSTKSNVVHCQDSGRISIIIREESPNYFTNQVGHVSLSMNSYTNYALLSQNMSRLLDSCKCITEADIRFPSDQQNKDSVELILQSLCHLKSLKTIRFENLNNVSQLNSFQNIDSLFIEIFDINDPYGNLNTDLNSLISNSDSIKFLYYERASGFLEPTKQLAKLVNDSMRIRRKDIFFTPRSLKKNRLEFAEIVWGLDTEKYYFSSGDLIKSEIHNFR